MKRIYILLAAFVLNTYAIAQYQQYPAAAGGADGIFIYLTDYNSDSVKIERSTFRSNKWEAVGTSSAPASSDEFLTRYERYSMRFPDLLKPQNSELGKIWSLYHDKKSIDSLYYYSASVILRLALGIAFFDEKAIKGTPYEYRISSAKAAGLMSVTTNSISYPAQTSLGKAVLENSSSKSDMVLIRWKIPAVEGFSTFLVYRQMNARGNYEKVNVLKGISSSEGSLLLSMQDRTVEQNNVYKYFIVPADLLGNNGEPSDTVTAGVYDFASVVLPYDLKAASDDSTTSLKLTWIMAENQPVAAMKIFRSENYDSAFSLVAEVNPYSSEYIDYDIEPMQQYFYYFQLTGPLNEVSPSTSKFFGFNQSPLVPIPPVNLRAENINNGIKLSWDNTENFIEGFWVYRSNGYSDSLRLISPLLQGGNSGVYFDTSGLTGKQTYLYAVRSLSGSHVLSPFSDTLAIRPAIKTFPPIPMGLTAETDESSSVLKWMDMTEIDSTISGYIVLRKNIGENSFKPLTDTIIPFHQNSFTDRSISAGNRYEYQVITLDIFGGISEPASANLDYPVVRPPAPEGLIAVVSGKGVELSWYNPQYPGITEYKIYRQTRNSEPLLIGKVASDKPLIFNDKISSNGELYFYFVTAAIGNNIESEKSSVISVRP